MRNARAAMLCAAIAGCTSTGSSGIATDDLFADYQLSLHDGLTTAQATFHVGDGDTGTAVELEGDDRVQCNGVSLAMTSSAIGQIWYEAEIPPTASPAVFELHRTGGDVSTSVGAPTAIAMTSPTATTVVSASQPFVVAWSPSGTGALVDISVDVTSGACTSQTVAADLPDTGTATVDGSTLAPPASGCMATLVVSRSLETTTQTAFRGDRLLSVAYDGASIAIRP